MHRLEKYFTNILAQKTHGLYILAKNKTSQNN